MQSCVATEPIQRAVVALLRAALARLPAPQVDAVVVALCQAFFARNLWPAIRQLHREEPRSREALRQLVAPRAAAAARPHPAGRY